MKTRRLPIISALIAASFPTIVTVGKGADTASAASAVTLADSATTSHSTRLDSIARIDSILLANFDKKEAEMKGKELGEVVVTARESRGVTSASLIDRRAMAHLQPSSFTDLVELLPGYVSTDPDMGKANLINLRQSPAASPDGFDTSSLGTSFVIDGVPVNTSAEMQATSDSDRSRRLTTGKGVDMRGISTDDIESVEIVRGIPSVEYGELTSGLVKIKRKQGASGLEARFKADMQSQLFYVGKGFDMPVAGWSVNLSADYLDSRIDPRDSRENFKRAGVSFRSNLKRPLRDKLQLTWDTSLNYTGTFERDKNDPDLTVNNTVDYYTNDVNTFSWNNALVILSPGNGFFNSASLTTGLSYADEHLRQQKTVASTRLYPLPVSTTPGPHYVSFLPMLYLADYDVYGKPFSAFVKGITRFRYRLGQPLSGWLKAGVEWNLSKNFGRGQVYDLTRPLSAGNTSRPRPFRDIPALRQLSAYVENESELRAGDHTFHLQLGVRQTQLLGLDNRYYLSGRIYLDPRVNLKWTLPYLDISSQPMVFELGVGAGLHTKMPVAAYLYPDKLYTDYVQLNYFHNDEKLRTMNVMTYVDDRTNHAIKAARNFKWEVRGDMSYRGNRLSVTYFRERMRDAFRMEPEVNIHTYNRYDASGHDPATGAPAIDNLPSTTETRIAMISRPANSSRVDKEGVEFTFSSRRFPGIRTRVTVNGAWFRTTLANSTGLWYRPSIIVNGKELSYAGYYDDNEGTVYQSFNTNFTFDTDIPRLKLNISLSVQNMWFTSNRTLWKAGIPTKYVGTDQVEHPWTDAAATDPYIGQLIRNYTLTAFDERRVPVATSFNIKATKKLWNDRIGIALYVNRLVSITPDYELYGNIQRRYTTPYFGMEMNLKL